MPDDIRDLRSQWIPVSRELGGQRWRLRFSHTAILMLAEHFGSYEDAGTALLGLLGPGPKKLSVLIAFLWAGLQEDAFAKYKAGKFPEEVLTVEKVQEWIAPFGLDETYQFFNDVFGAWRSSQPDHEPENPTNLQANSGEPAGGSN